MLGLDKRLQTIYHTIEAVAYSVRNSIMSSPRIFFSFVFSGRGMAMTFFFGDQLLCHDI